MLQPGQGRKDHLTRKVHPIQLQQTARDLLQTAAKQTIKINPQANPSAKLAPEDVVGDLMLAMILSFLMG